MLFVGNQRGGAKNLAAHLMNDRDNEHVEVHEVRGFASHSVNAAFNEAYAISRGTKCKQFLYSLSINPPADKAARTQDFIDAVERAEERLGLIEQPRVIVFHEKNGRRHAHAVWSRIDADEMKAISMSHDRYKLQNVSRELHIEHGWRMPQGMADKSLRDPKNFTLDEWQQAKRQGKDPRAIKTALQDAWASSDNQKSFAHALKARGYTLARGDRRGVVAVDHKGAVYALGKKWLGVTAKAVKTRLPDTEHLPDVETAKVQTAQEMKPVLSRFERQIAERRGRHIADHEKRKQGMIAKHRAERKAMTEKLEQRRIAEMKARHARFRSGLSGFWDRLRGEHKRIQQRNEREALQAMQRDRTQKDAFIRAQREDRLRLDQAHQKMLHRLDDRHKDIVRDQKHCADMTDKKTFTDQRRSQSSNAQKSHDENTPTLER